MSNLNRPFNDAGSTSSSWLSPYPQHRVQPNKYVARSLSQGPPSYAEAIRGSRSPAPSSFGNNSRRSLLSPESEERRATLEEVLNINVPQGLLGRFSPERKQFDKLKKELEVLRKYDTIIVVDDSNSMHGKRWKDACQALAVLSEVAMIYDQDGVDIYFLNNPTTDGENIKSSEAVEALFAHAHVSPGTPIGRRLGELTSQYVATLKESYHAGTSVKPRNYIVITDGMPSDRRQVTKVINGLSRFLTEYNYPESQLGIQFLQIGNDKGATDFLQGLDGDFRNPGTQRDIVDASPYNSEEPFTAGKILKVLKGAIDRRLDRSGSVGQY